MENGSSEMLQKTPVSKGRNEWLFNFEDAEKDLQNRYKRGPCPARGCSSAGRAPALQAGGQEFDPPHLHQKGEENERKTKDSENRGRIAQVVRAHA